MVEGAVLVTGGAGYIGSHAVLAFRESGYAVVVLDDLSTGRRDSVPSDVDFVDGDAGDLERVCALIRAYRIRAVVHFAGSIVVPESVADPLAYYRNNTCVSRNLIQACVEEGVRTFIFSSTAVVYGNPDKIPISEDAPTSPVSPYATSKLMTEHILRDTAAAHDFIYVAMRYFNVAGADPLGRSGQSTPNATHLIKAASQAAVGRRGYVEIFGQDYETPDGTCIRDYIHVTDLAKAHVAALRYVETGAGNLTVNCGYGHGYSVREVLQAVERETGARLELRPAPRRPGDAAILVADPRRICERLDWRPEHDDLFFIVRTAIEWERRLAAE